MSNRLIFVDMPTPDLEGAKAFYEGIFGWQVNRRPPGEFLQVVPEEGLHLGLFHETLQPPVPEPSDPAPRSHNQPRVYIIVDDDVDSFVDQAVARGGTEMWRKTHWDEFNGHHASFMDPWGNQIILWQYEPGHD